MLQDAYGEDAVLEPHVMPVEAFSISNTAGHTAILPFFSHRTFADSTNVL